FRLPPHPMFWLVVYLMLDWGSVAPYLAVNAAVTVDTVILQRLPDIKNSFNDWMLHKIVCTVLYVSVMVPLVFGGKIYNSLKLVGSFKLIVVIGFLTIVGILFAKPIHWLEIFTGLFKFGTLPVVSESGYDTDNIFRTLWSEGRLPRIDFALFGVIAGLASI